MLAETNAINANTNTIRNIPILLPKASL